MKRNKHHTAWAGALAVASELSRRSYDATLTLGNTPTLDLLCASPRGKPFKVQVKSLTTENAVLIQKHMLEGEPQPDLFFAIVIVPASETEPMQFRIMTHREVVKHWREIPKVKKNGQPYKPGMDGLNWSIVKPYTGGWDKLPQ
jgi:hypothetical protein